MKKTKCSNASVWSVALLTCFFTLSTVNAQKVKIYKVWVTLSNETKVKGILYAANEETLVLQGDDLIQIELVPENIEQIKIRRRGNVGKGAWMGAVGGTALGAIIGYSLGDDDQNDLFYYTAAEKSALGAILGAPIGTLIGIGIGLGQKRYIINGNRSVYLSQLPILQMHLPQTSH